jgi:hypothetical protein
MMSFRMIVALVDISEALEEKDSPRYDHRTRGALERRELITMDGKKLTKKGKAYLEMCLFEYDSAEDAIDAQRTSREAA